MCIYTHKKSIGTLKRRKTSRLGVMYKIYSGLVQCPISTTKLVLPPSCKIGAPTVNSLASSPPEHSTEVVPFYPAPPIQGLEHSLQGCSRGDDCRHFCVTRLPLTNQLFLFCFVFKDFLFCVVLRTSPEAQE